MKFFVILVLLIGHVFAKPYPNPKNVISPPVPKFIKNKFYEGPTVISARDGMPILRVEVDWQEENEKFSVKGIYQEKSGTKALLSSSLKKDRYGSYKAQLSVKTDKGETTLHSSLGTGREFRYLVRKFSFRFPHFDGVTEYKFSLEAENPTTGKMEKVLHATLNPVDFLEVPSQDVRITLLRKAKTEPVVKLTFYAEGFNNKGEVAFIGAAKKAVATLEKNLPGSDAFEFRAVFAPSNTKLGPAKDFGPGIKPRDTFMGLYFPYWRKVGRWYNIVYPTDVTKYRNALAQAAYDYPVALVDDGAYWGVGNYKEVTAIPIKSEQFTYLLLHEFGHFMGLNEEYEGGGPTELEFAPGISEPWSQNITFNTDPLTIKWKKHLEPGIKIPTSLEEWMRFGGNNKNPVGAYQGGYADSPPENRSHKPVRKCMMSAGGDFCPICDEALRDMILIDGGR